MSLGSTASGYPMSSYGKLNAPWQQGLKPVTKKKFSYTNKTNKIPLRDRLKQTEEAQLVQAAEEEARARANKMLAERRRREQDLKSSRKNATSKTPRAERPAQNGILKNKEPSSKSSNVTLTQDQLSAILQTLSKVQGSSKDVKLDIEDKEHLTLTVDKTDSSVPVSRESNQSISSTTQQLESVLNLSKRVKTSENAAGKTARTGSVDKKELPKKKPSKQVVMNFNLGEKSLDTQKNKTKAKKQVKIAEQATSEVEEPVFVRGPAKVVVVDEKSANETDSASAANNSAAADLVANTKTNYPEKASSPELSPRQKLLLIPRAHMTIGERKRLQWELENAAIDKLKKENEERAKRLGISQNNTKELTKDNKGQVRETHKTSKGEEIMTREKLREAVVFVEPDFVPGLGELSSQGEPNTVKQPTNTKEGLPRLSKAEQKRLQWKREQADALEDYDPWGRPGVGVGPKSSQSSVKFQKQQLTSEEQVQEKLKLNLTSGPKNSSHSQNDANSQTRSQPDTRTKPNSNVSDLRGPFQEPTNGAPTSLLGLENPPREILKSSVDATAMPTKLSKAQLLKLKWAEEKAILDQEYDPFGKPGAGAPIRTDSGTVLTIYHSRQKHMLRKSIEEHQSKHQEGTTPHTQKANAPVVQPDYVPGLNLNHSDSVGVKSEESETNARNHIRGQLVNLDPATLKEREELRRKELRYQEEIRQQVEEKQRLRQEERLRKLKEEAEEEAKFRAEQTNQQQESEHVRHMNKIKQEEPKVKDMNLGDELADSIKRAAQEAEILKARKRLEKLQAAGHDISNLKAAYEQKFSPRVGPIISEILTPRKNPDAPDTLSPRVFDSQANRAVEPTSVPGLNLSPRDQDTHQGHYSTRQGHNTTRQGHNTTRQGRNTARAVDSNTGGYISNRVVTPRKWQGVQKEQSPMKEFGVQTDTPPPTQKSTRQQKVKPPANERNPSSATKKNVRVISGPKARKAKQPPEPKPWGWKNQTGKKFTGQSKRDPHFEEKQEEKIVRAQARKEQLLRQVDANIRHIPNGRATRSSVELTNNKDRESVNNHLSPRHKLSDTVPAAEALSKQPKLKDNSVMDRKDKSSSVQTAANQLSDSGDKKENINTRTRRDASVYEPSLTNMLSTSPVEEYVPFRRSDAVLSPSNAQEPSPMSREGTQVALAREAYYKSMKPAQYGVHMHNIKDSHQPTPKSEHSKDPLYNPSLLTKHPTDRQQQVLDSLRQMRQGLMAKQREIESVITPDTLATHY